MLPGEMMIQGVAMSAYSWSGYNGTGYESLLQQAVEVGATSVLLGSVSIIDLNNGAVSAWMRDDGFTTTASMENVEAAIQQAQAHGLQVFLKPQIHSYNPASAAFGGNPYNNLINPDPSNPLIIPNLDLFFEGYKAYIVEWAELAERYQVPLFSVGNEMVAVTSAEFTPYWEDIIASVRNVYHGQLTYSAMTDVKWESNDEVSQIEFWDKLDYVGVDVYPDFETGEATPTVAELNAIWQEQEWKSYLGTIAEATGKPLLFTETGVASFLGGANRSRYTDALISQLGTITDYATQTNWFQSFAETWMGESQPEWFGGMYFWNNDPPYNAGLQDITGYTFFGKPAEVVVSSLFDAVNSLDFDQTLFLASDSDDRIALYKYSADANPLTRAQSYHSTVIIELNGTILEGAEAVTPIIHFYLNGKDYGAVTLSPIESEWSKNEWLKSGENQELYKAAHYGSLYVPHSELVSFFFEIDELEVRNIRIVRDSVQVENSEVYISRVTIVPDMGAATVNSLQNAWVQFAEPSAAWGGQTGYQFPNGAVPYDVPSVTIDTSTYNATLATMSGTPDNPITVKGYEGFDTVYLLGSPEQYTITLEGDMLTVAESSGLGQNSQLGGVECLLFAEADYALLFGGMGNDTLYGGAGNDRFNGGDGNDVVLLSGYATEYEVSYHEASTTYTITDSVAGRDGSDQLRNIEALQFGASPMQWNLEEFRTALAASQLLPQQEEPFNVTGSVTFWKNGAAISNVATTLSLHSVTNNGEELLFQHLQHHADGGYSVDVWADATEALHSLQFEFQLPTNAQAAWHFSEAVPQGWQTGVNNQGADALLIGGMGATALPSGLVQLGTLSFVAPTDADRLEIALTRGELGKQWLVPATITLESNVLASNGGYQHNALWQGSYHLSVQHESTEEPTNMVTMSDAYAALRIAAGHNPNESEAPLQPWQFLAADINRDGKVRASDALTILKMALNYHDAPSEEWIFLPEWVGKSEMTRSSVDWSAAEIMLDVENYQIVNLIGVIQGDVDGSFS